MKLVLIVWILLERVWNCVIGQRFGFAAFVKERRRFCGRQGRRKHTQESKFAIIFGQGVWQQCRRALIVFQYDSMIPQKPSRSTHALFNGHLWYSELVQKFGVQIRQRPIHYIHASTAFFFNIRTRRYSTISLVLMRSNASAANRQICLLCLLICKYVGIAGTIVPAPSYVSEHTPRIVA